MGRNLFALATAGLLGVLPAGTVALGQGDEAARVLTAARDAVGGEKKLEQVRSLSVEGRSLRTNPAGATVEGEFEMAIELPDKFMRREVLQAMGNMSVYRTWGFNGGGVINEIDSPPQLSGNVRFMVRMGGPGGTGGGPPTREQQEQARLAMLRSSKQEFARLALGMFPRSPDAYPLTFTYAGSAESPDGKADVLDVKGEEGFTARLFIDSQTHLPLMLSWMDKEPIVITRTQGGRAPVPAGRGAPPPAPAAGEERKGVAPGERGQMTKDAEAQIQAAEASSKVVEFRIFYSDYQSVGGILLPHRFQRSIDGRPTEEIVFERVRINPRIDAKKFAVSK